MDFCHQLGSSTPRSGNSPKDKSIHNVERLLAAGNGLPAAGRLAIDMLTDQLVNKNEKKTP